MRTFVLVFAAFVAAAMPAAAQFKERTPEQKQPALPIYVQVGKTFYQGDSIPEIITPVVNKFNPIRKEKNQREFQILVRRVKRVLPYAKTARMLLLETYSVLETLPDKKAKAEHVKRVEAELKKQYTPIVKKMSRTDGRLLVKLIDRECNQTGFSIARAFVGPLRANVYQSIGLLFGNSLAKHYDPEGDDAMVERVVRMVESGQI